MERDIFFSMIVFLALELKLYTAESVHHYQCSRTYLGRLGNGVISSYNYPFDYRDNLTCVYRIYIDNKPNSSQTVCLTYRRFSLENSSPFCSFDYVELGLNPPVKYCGTGLWQYGVEEKGNLFSNVWSPNLCWSVQNMESFDLVFSSDNSINGTGFYATFQVYSTTFNRGLSFGASLDQGPCRLSEWTCFNRKCVSQKHLCNGQNDCGDWSDESYTHARCKGQNVLACDFSDESGGGGGFCELNHEGWIRSSEIKKLNGPPGDHTNGTSGFYIYSERSSFLISSALSLPENTTYCLSFWYFVYGKNPSVSLSVYVNREQAYSRPEWSRHVSGTTQTHRWSVAEMVIDFRSSVQIIFATQPSNNESGTALDDISITQGSCSGVDITCNFELSLCGWQSATQLHHGSGTWIADRSWKIHSQASGSSGPKWDHSSNDGSGSYLYTNFLAPVSKGSQAILISPTVSTLPGDLLCLRFWYYMGRQSPSACLLSLLLHHYDNVLSGDIWSQVAQGDDAWKLASVEFEADGPLQVILLASLRSENSDVDCEVAIDELRLDAGRCLDESGVVCDSGQYLCLSGHCIDSLLVCDKIPHCRDGSDEDWRAGCFAAVDSASGSTSLQTTGVICPPATSFLCHSSSFCIPRGWLCDLFNDCGDMSDEGPLAGCPDDGLLLYPSTVGAEVNLTFLDSVPQSGHGTEVASSPGATCEFSCADGVCISLLKRCDRVKDCTSGQDEVNCSELYIPPLTACQSPSMLCLNENRCLAANLVCDGKDDCQDGADEAIRICPEKLSVGAVAGIIFGCCFSLLILLLVALLARRRRKNCPIRQTRRPNHPPGHISTVFSVNNPGGVSQQINALSAFVAQNVNSEQRQDRNRDNMGYVEEANRDASGRAYPSELQMIFGEAPPPYNSVLLDSGNQVDRRRVLIRGNSADELEIPASHASQDQSETSQVCEPLVAHSRNRRSYRSLPPTPARQPLVSYLQTPDDQQQCGQQMSLLGYGAVSVHGANGNAGGEPVYEDPSGSMRRASRSGTQLSSPLVVNLPADVFHQSSMISPTLSSQRASRIRLGTMALQNRTGTIHGHSIHSPVSSWHSAVGSDASRQLCYCDQSGRDSSNTQRNEMALATIRNELMPDDSPGAQYPPTHRHCSHHDPSKRISQTFKAVCLPATTQQQTYSSRGQKAIGERSRTANCNHDAMDVYGDYQRPDPESSFHTQHRDRDYLRSVRSKHTPNCVAPIHRRSSSSSGFHGNPKSTGDFYPNCDDVEFFSPSCI